MLREVYWAAIYHTTTNTGARAAVYGLLAATLASTIWYMRR